MVIHYYFPVIRFYGDDPEDFTKTYQEAEVSFLLDGTDPREAEINAPGYHFRLIFGNTVRGKVFLCIPNRASGFELDNMEDAVKNIEAMTWYCSNIDYEDCCAIAFALREISVLY